MEMLTLDAFEEAAECVKRVTQETKLMYSDYFSEQTGNKGISEGGKYAGNRCL